jgi:iron-sulfur cluster assembly protein
LQGFAYPYWKAVAPAISIKWDLSCESRGLAVFIDPSSVPLISGTMIDFIDSLEGAGFAFNNPQAKSTCGCGKSFC